MKLWLIEEKNAFSQFFVNFSKKKFRTEYSFLRKILLHRSSSAKNLSYGPAVTPFKNFWQSLLSYESSSTSVALFQWVLIIFNKCWSFSMSVDHFQRVLIIFNECWSFSTSVDHFQQVLIIFNECWSFSTSVDRFQQVLIIINECWLSSTMINDDDRWQLIMINDDWWW